MNTFTDGKGRTWRLGLTVGMIRSIRERTGLEFGKLIATERGLAEFLFGDPETFARVLWIMVEADAEKAKVEPEDFAYAIDGPTIEAATQALLGAIADFFPRSAIAQTIKTRLPEVMKTMDDRLRKEANRQIDKAIQSMTSSTLSESAGSLPASLDSIPAR